MHHYAVGYLPIKDPAYRHLNKKNPYYDEEKGGKALDAIKKDLRGRR